MTFANPQGLLGLTSLLVVLALHLMRHRSRRYVVSSLGLWSFLDVEVRGSRPRRIPLTWLLILDLLIAALLSLSWAEPHVELALPLRDTRHVVVMLDVSASMQARDVAPSRFSQAQLDALSLLGNVGPKDTVTVLTMGRGITLVGDTRENELPQILARITELEAGEMGCAMEEGLAHVLTLLRAEIPPEIHVFTDGAFPEPALGDFPHPIEWHVRATPAFNTAALNLSAQPVGESETQILAQFGNFSENTTRHVVSLLVGDVPVDSATLIMEARAITSRSWTVSGHPETISVKLMQDDLLVEDDTASIGLHYDRLLRIGLVTESPDLLERALRAIGETEPRVIPPEEYVPGLPFDLVIFRGTLPDAWPAGNVLVVDPPTDSSLLQIEGLEPIEEIPVPSSDELFLGVDLTGIRWGQTWVLRDVPKDTVPLLRAGEIPLILQGRWGASQVFLFLPDPDTGNLAHHPAFPIMMANLMRMSSGSSLPAAIKPGENIPLPPEDAYPHIEVIPPQGDPVTIDHDRSLGFGETTEPGIYHLEMVDLDGNTERYSVGVNLGDLEESNLAPQAWVGEAQSIQWGETGETVLHRQVNLTPWLLGLTALLVLLEARLAWR